MIVITATTAGYVPFALNLQRQLAAHDIPLGIVALDSGAVERLTAAGSPPVHVIESPPDDDLLMYGTPAFNRVCFRKLDAIAAAFEEAPDEDAVMWLDGDIGVPRDPGPEIKRALQIMQQLDLHIAMQSDEPTTQITDHAVEGGAARWKCAGLVIWRRTDATMQILRDHASFHATGKDDQDYTNWAVATHRVPCMVLSRALFPNGIFVNEGAVPADAVMVHYNYMMGDAKVGAMRAAGHWLLDSSDAQKRSM